MSTGTPRRYAFVVGVRPELRARYLELHSAVWPQVEQTLRDANVTNYSIFIVGDTLFAYYEYVGEDHDADMARIAEDPVTRQWWTHTDPCQRRIADERVPGALWQPIDEIWHLS
ncbi:L-rhamnose mutarotase [Catenuloplanes sp. NPDC051500]|uniref:L-rhamnose mutarotase n=1 Tax=Catenuloplanes sp. NPDC051500 TaxID=3363959 RepID=UPI003790B7B1